MTQTPYVEQKLAEEKVFKDPIHKYIRQKINLFGILLRQKSFNVYVVLSN